MSTNFAMKIAPIIDPNPRPNNHADCKRRSDWKDWHVAITTQTWQFGTKQGSLLKGFTQRPDVDIEETYSLVMDGITFRYLISMAVNLDFTMKLMDVVPA